MKAPFSRLLACLIGVLAQWNLMAGSSVVVFSGPYGAISNLIGMSNVTSISCGGNHILALRPDGTLTAWGADGAGQCETPPGRGPFKQVAAGMGHSLALEMNGRVVAWGYNDYGQTNVPDNLTNIVAVAAGFWHSMALTADGKVVAWGYNDYGQTSVPPTLAHVTAISGGSRHSLALKEDGTVVAWGGVGESFGDTAVPANLRDVCAIGAGNLFSLALRNDGTVVEWPSAAPAGLQNIAMISCGDSDVLALGADGTLNGWGNVVDGGIWYGLAIPTGLGKVACVSAGGYIAAALTSDGSPFITRQPLNRRVFEGAPITLSGTVVGDAPLRFQWQKDGQDMPGETNSSLRIAMMDLSHAGQYRFFCTNQLGSAISAPAKLDLVSDVPKIISQPQDLQVPPGTTVSFSPDLEGAMPFTFQWKFNGSDIPAPNGTNATLVISNTQWTDRGFYSVSISNYLGATNSAAAQLDLLQLVGCGTTLTSPTVPLRDIEAISAGNGYKVILMKGGVVTHWLDEFYGIPDLPPYLTNLVAIGAGNIHGVGLRADGSVTSWGRYRHSPTQQWVAMNNSSDYVKEVVAIASGASHCLALKNDGSVFAWGDDVNGQCDLPPGLGNVVAIAGGLSHSLALLNTGRLVAWGQMQVGSQLLQAFVPPEATNIIAIACGASHNLAIRADGRVLAWGNNIDHQCDVPEELRNVTAICGGASHSLALTAEGTVVGWGANTNGQLSFPAGLHSGAAISAGTMESWVLARPPSLYCIKNPNDTAAYRGRFVVLSGAFIGTQPITYQWRHEGTNFPCNSPTLAIDSADEPTTGSYQLIASNSFGSVATVPAVVKLNPNVAPIIVPVYHTNVTYSGGSSALWMPVEGPGPLLYQWGLNGQPIDGATNAVLSLSNTDWIQEGDYTLDVSNPWGTSHGQIRVELVRLVASGTGPFPNQNKSLPSGRDLVSIALGGNHVLGLRTNGTVLAWGGGAATNVPVGLAGVAAISAGRAHSLVLLSNGTIRVWGENGFGQSTPPANAQGISAIASGLNHNIALLSNGMAVAWGDNLYGQCRIPANATNITAIGAGQAHSLAVTARGSVIAWGNNSYHQSSVPGFLTNVIAVAAGANHSVALRSDGTVCCWGYTTNTPVGLSNVVAVFAGGNTSAAIKSDSSVVFWGNNSNGQTNFPADLRDVVSVSINDVASLVLCRPFTLPQLQIKNFEIASAGMFRFQFSGALGAHYIIEVTDSLNPPSWKQWHNLDGTNGYILYQESASNTLHRFYRVRGGR